MLDVSLVIRHRLRELGLEQRDLAAAALVTESYISQLLARKKAPPTPGRTDIYDRIERFLKLPQGELSRMADVQRKEDLKKRVTDPAQPLFQAFRDLILRKCAPRKRLQIREIFEKEPFGVLERLVAQQLLNVAKRAAEKQLSNEKWLQSIARLSGTKTRRTRVMLRELLDTDVFHVSTGSCISLLDPLIEWWDIDLETFGIEITLNSKLADEARKRFDFVEREPERPFPVEPGLADFLRNPVLSGDAKEDEIGFLKSLRLKNRRPLPLYYYRILQDTRDPLHFGSPPETPEA